jgi:hypothetical protein
MKLRLFCCTAPANQRSEPSHGFTERFGGFFPSGSFVACENSAFFHGGMHKTPMV